MLLSDAENRYNSTDDQKWVDASRAQHDISEVVLPGYGGELVMLGRGNDNKGH